MGEVKLTTAEFRERRLAVLADPDAVEGVFVAVFPILGEMSMARLQRQALIQITEMPSAQGVVFTGQWSWTVVPAGRGRRFLVARAEACTSAPPGDVAAAVARFLAALQAAAPATLRVLPPLPALEEVPA